MELINATRRNHANLCYRPAMHDALMIYKLPHYHQQASTSHGISSQGPASHCRSGARCSTCTDFLFALVSSSTLQGGSKNVRTGLIVVDEREKQRLGRNARIFGQLSQEN
jgi:hypothetical protein